MKDTSNYQNEDKTIDRNSISKYGEPEGMRADIGAKMRFLTKSDYSRFQSFCYDISIPCSMDILVLVSYKGHLHISMENPEYPQS